MKNINNQQLARRAGDLLYIYLFIAGYNQLKYHGLFLQNINQLTHSPLLSDVVSYAVPFATIILAFYLRGGKALGITLTTAVGMMLLFTMFSLWRYLYGQNLRCACNSYWDNLTAQDHLFINAGMSLVAMAGALLAQKRHDQNLIRQNDLFP